MPILILAQLAPKCGTIRPESLAQLAPKWVAQLAPDYPPTMTSVPSKGAITLLDVPEFVSSNDNIHANDIGFFVPENNPQDNTLNQSNIILRNHTVVSDHNNYGVYVAKGGTDENGLDYGLVLMDCAELLDNQIGIGGVDVLLQIDAIENSGTSDPTYWRSNTFRNLPLGLLFAICYDERSVDVTGISAQGNFWFDPNISNNIQTMHRLQDANVGQGCVGYYPSVPVDVTNAVAQQPSSCPSPSTTTGTIPTTKDCSITTNNNLQAVFQLANSNSTTSTMAVYREAYSEFLKQIDNDEMTNSARARFHALASVDNNYRNQAGRNCKKYIDVARVLAISDYNANPFNALQAGETSIGVIEDRQFINKQSTSTMNVYPNPSTGMINIELQQEGGFLRISNSQGTRIPLVPCNDRKLLINLSQFSDGVCFVTHISNQGEIISIQKIILEK